VELKNTTLLIPWLQDPLKECFPHSYQKAIDLQDLCRRNKIPIINKVESLSNSIKSTALKIIAKTGIRTAKVIPIVGFETFDPKAHGLSYPFFIREDQRHGGSMSLICNYKDLGKFPWKNFLQPVAVEFIDIQSKDGYYRKYRYVMMGNVGVPRHLVISGNWCTHADGRINTNPAREEELRYLQCISDPNHARLNQARMALGFDFVAFDYGYDQEGSLVVWEPNPLPIFWNHYNEQTDCFYQKPTIDRLYKALLSYYLQRANMEGLICDE